MISLSLLPTWGLFEITPPPERWGRMAHVNPSGYSTSRAMTQETAQRYLRLLDALAEAAEDLQECEYGHPECAHHEGGACSAEAYQIAEHGSRL